MSTTEIRIPQTFNTLRPVFGQGFDRFFDGVFGPTSLAGRSEDVASSTWTPAVDVRETEEAILVEADLPGLRKEDIQISLEDGVLTVSGSRGPSVGESTAFHRRERLTGSFRRAFRVPSAIDQTKIAATFENGVLILALPKAAEAKPRQITIG